MTTREQLLAIHARQLAVLDAKLPENLERQALKAISDDLLGSTGVPLPANRARPNRPMSWSAHARDAAEAVIRELKRPVPLSELYQAIEARGIPLGGKYPSRRLSAILGDAHTLISTERGWWIADERQQAEKAQAQTTGPRKRVGVAGTKYSDLAVRALEEAGQPLRTHDIIQFMRQHRPLPAEIDRRTVVNITSAFSHDQRLHNVRWFGTRTWWFKDRPMPPETMNGHEVSAEENSAGLGPAEISRVPDA
jgi:hypothetical protein